MSLANNLTSPGSNRDGRFSESTFCPSHSGTHIVFVNMDDDINSSDIEVDVPARPFASAGAKSIADMLDVSASTFI